MSRLDLYTPSVGANVDVLTLGAGTYVAINMEQRIKFESVAGAYNLGYIGSGFHTASGGYLAFGTVNAGGSSQAASERLRIDNNGNVGIGTTAPSAKLQVTSGQVAIDIPSTLAPTGTTQST